LASAANVKLPEESAVTLALAAPLNVTVAPLPEFVGLIAPDMLNVAVGVVKLRPVTLVPLTVKFRLTGLKVNPVLLGVTV
jgi:hypothetical protein